ncbi:hypothetical protein [Halosimplex pelagicum]|uniref:Uncharacterized protein n=1 Tax=Halosimplex pelagicum TaxID=869886 RepID=A0A7D5PFN0_9EURY|nr:hypothetical protein [Halosimplex pelagicum]QLH83480.1 hypothetical protein HZS54_18405 [Halosimplex pelagicum]
MAQRDLGELLTDTRVNAGVGWALVGVFGLVTVESALGGDFLWAAFAAIVGLVVALPALVRANPRAMAPAEVVLLAGLPVVGRAVATVQVTSTVAVYLSIAAFALLVAVNLHLFTPVEMSIGFAVLFVVVTTLAAAGLWALARWGSDVHLGTTLLLDPGPDGVLSDADFDQIEHELMVEFVASGIAGLVAGLVFQVYVRRRATVVDRIEGGAV